MTKSSSHQPLTATELEELTKLAETVMGLEGGVDEFDDESDFHGLGMGKAEREYYAKARPQIILRLIEELKTRKATT